jgi:hydroxypyruvate isomerase
MSYTEAPFLERFARAAAAGFAAVEFLFPYEAGVEAVKARVDDLGLAVALFNLHAGDRDAGEWGTSGNSAQRDYSRWSFSTALEAAARLKCRRIHALFGNRLPELEPEAQVACAVENLLWAAPQAAEARVTLLVEWLNPTDFPNFFLHTTAAAMGIVAQVDHPAVKLQYDVLPHYGKNSTLTTRDSLSPISDPLL